MTNLEIEYVSATSIGIFEQTSDGYGEIWYHLGGKQEMSRITTGEGVLESIYTLAGVTLPQETSERVFRGHPLAVPPDGAATLFYGLWPALALSCAVLVHRRFRQ